MGSELRVLVLVPSFRCQVLKLCVCYRLGQHADDADDTSCCTTTEVESLLLLRAYLSLGECSTVRRFGGGVLDQGWTSSTNHTNALDKVKVKFRDFHTRQRGSEVH